MNWVEETTQRSVDKELEKFARNVQMEWQKIANDIIKYFYCIMILR